MSGWGYFFLFLLLVIIVAPIAWIVFTRVRAQRAGLPPPPLSSYNPFSNRRDNPASQIYPAPGGIVGWVKDKYNAVRNKVGGGGVSRTGAYEQTSGNTAGGAGIGGGRGRRGADPDEAWDARVGAEADGYGAGGYYEEQELGLTGPSTHEGPYAGGGGGGGGAMPAYGSEEMGRGRSRGRDDTAYVGSNQAGLDQRYDEEVHGGTHDNPFGDGAERSELRGVSPRPHEEGGDGSLKAKKEEGDSPTERRSMFRENV